MILHHDVPGLVKGERYEVGIPHPDIVGGWNGYRTWMVPYTDDEGETHLILYVAIGDYFDVGPTRGRGHKHSRFAVISLIADLMEDGMSPDVIFDAVKSL